MAFLIISFLVSLSKHMYMVALKFKSENHVYQMYVYDTWYDTRFSLLIGSLDLLLPLRLFFIFRGRFSATGGFHSEIFNTWGDIFRRQACCFPQALSNFNWIKDLWGFLMSFVATSSSLEERISAWSISIQPLFAMFWMVTQSCLNT